MPKRIVKVSYACNLCGHDYPGKGSKKRARDCEVSDTPKPAYEIGTTFEGNLEKFSYNDGPWKIVLLKVVSHRVSYDLFHSKHSISYKVMEVSTGYVLEAEVPEERIESAIKLGP